MKEYFLKELTSLVDLAKVGLQKGIEVIQAEAPELVQQVLRWNFTMSLLGFILGLVVLTVAIITVKKLLKLNKENPCSPADYGFSAIMVGFVGGVVSIAICVTNHAWLKILVAPKLYLIEYLSGLIK